MDRRGGLWRLYRRLRGADRRKREAELTYWREQKAAEGELGNAHYEMLFTRLFDLEPSFYGTRTCSTSAAARAAASCGRAGQAGASAWTRWPTTTGRSGRRAIRWSTSRPRPRRCRSRTGSSTSWRRINSLDHVDDLERTVAEIKRITRPGGHVVLAVEVGHEPTWTEPQSFAWDVCAVFEPEFEIVSRGEWERDDGWMFDAALRRKVFDHSDRTFRPGVLTAVMRRR